MLAIKLSRTGKKRQPYYRILVLEKRKDPWGDYKELLGNYNPRTKELVIKEDRLKYWISVGAQMSNTVHNLMIKNNIIDEKPKKAVTISKKRISKMAKKKKAEEEVKSAKTKEETPKETPVVDPEPAEAVVDPEPAEAVVDPEPAEAVVDTDQGENTEEKPALAKATGETKK